MQASFNIDPDQDESIGVLMYKLQEKNTVRFGEATCTQLLIIWKVNKSKVFWATSRLVEHDKSRVWDEVGLMKLTKHYVSSNVHYGLIEDTWLMHDNTVLMTRINVICEEECYKLEMTVSETSIEDDTQRPQYISLYR
jgi:hypothetical protein